VCLLELLCARSLFRAGASVIYKYILYGAIDWLATSCAGLSPLHPTPYTLNMMRGHGYH